MKRIVVSLISCHPLFPVYLNSHFRWSWCLDPGEITFHAATRTSLVLCYSISFKSSLYCQNVLKSKSSVKSLVWKCIWILLRMACKSTVSRYGFCTCITNPAVQLYFGFFCCIEEEKQLGEWAICHGAWRSFTLSPPQLKTLSTGAEIAGTPSTYRANLLTTGIFFECFLQNLIGFISSLLSTSILRRLFSWASVVLQETHWKLCSFH